MTEVISVPTSLSKVEKVIHLADIHIRLYKRHNEYQEVFQNLYTSLKQQNLKNAVIVVVGDIVHSKTDMSPEMVTVASEFLKSLADIAPTIIIAGNHDLSLSNPNRLDALTPLVENLKHKNLYYFKNSGIYQFADVHFGVHSIIGEPSDWPSMDGITGTKIALYHGPIHNAKTEAGFVITNKINLEFFKDYDMVMLGDIHLTQFLQEKTIDKPEVFYVGSLIQQNFGESLSNHGYAVWDVVKKKVDGFVEVENSYGYYTLVLDGKNVPVISDMPQNVRLRIICDKDTEISFIKKIQATLRKKYNILESSVNYTSKDSIQSDMDDDSLVDNIQDINQQNSLIRSYIESKFPNTEDEIIEKVFVLNKKLNSQIADDELPKNIHWKPLQLKFDNLFSYGENNEINFENMNGLYGLFAPNAQGKTSAFQSLCYTLYDKTPQAFKGSHIMNSRKDTFSCELKFKTGENVYVIERKGIRKKDGEVKVDVNFYRIEKDNSHYSLNGIDRRDTNANIRSYVGTYEDFILTTLSVQNQNNLFIEIGQSDRKDLLSQFIGLTIFDRLFVLGSNEIKEVNGALKAFKQTDFTQKLADTQISLETRQVTLDEITKNLEDQQKLQESIINQITKLSEQKVPNIEIIDKVPIENKLSKSAITIETAESELETTNQQLTVVINSVKNIDVPNGALHGDLQQKVNALRDATVALLKLKSEYNVILAKQTAEQENNIKIQTHKFDPSCEYCIENHHDLIKELETSKSKINELGFKLYDLNDEIMAGEKFISENTLWEQKLKEYEDGQKIRTDLLRKQAELTLSKERLEQLIKNELQVVKNCREKISLYDTNKKLIEENQHLDIEIKKLEVEKNKSYQKLLELQKLNQIEHGQIEVLKNQKQEMLKSLKESENLENTLEAYELYLTVIGRDGLPYDLITKVIPTLQSEVNDILSQIVNFTLLLDIDGKNINGKIVYDVHKQWALELASGMEKFVVGLAIRIALLNISNLPKSNFLVIDEGFGVLDSDNLSSVSMLFNILKTNFEFIILISHLDSIRDVTENLIEIRREDGFSHINVT